MWHFPAAVWALAEQEEKKRRQNMLEKIRVKNVTWTDPILTEGGGSKFQWAFEIESVDGAPLVHEKRDGIDYYNGVSMWLIKLEAERIAREKS